MTMSRSTEAEVLAEVAADELEMALEGHMETARTRAAVRGAFAALAKLTPRDIPGRFENLMGVWYRWMDFAPYLAAWETEQRLAALDTRGCRTCNPTKSTCRVK